MKIAFVTDVVYPFVTGGAQKRIYEIGTRLADYGHDVTIYSRHYWDGSKEMTLDGMTHRAVAPAAELYTESGRRSILEAVDFAVRLTPKLRRNIDEHDLVIASVFPYFPVFSSKLCASVGTPLITTWHEVWRDYWNDYLGTLAMFGRGVEHLTAKIPQYPIAVSCVTADRLAKIGPRREQITVLPNGIDIERIQSIPPVDDGFDILFAGRLIKDKRVGVLLDAFDRIVGAHSVSLGIIGDGPQREELESKVNDRSIRNVEFIGFLDEHDDVLAHMKSAEIFASLSTREGFGITYLEAMAAGCTVIGADHPDSAASEVIGDAGFVIEPTVEELVKCLDEALNGAQPLDDPSAVASQYDWDSVANEAAKVYSSVLNERTFSNNAFE